MASKRKKKLVSFKTKPEVRAFGGSVEEALEAFLAKTYPGVTAKRERGVYDPEANTLTMKFTIKAR